MINSDKKNICPRCKQTITEYPALSRKDNVTYICSDCGVAEALEIFFNNLKQTKQGN